MNQTGKMPDKPSEPISAQVISNPFSSTTSHNVNTAPTSTATPSATASQEPPADAPPPSAADNDLIEKIWVEAVRKMSKQYADDPFELQQRQAQLTRDYLKKRFGREINAS